MAQFRVPSFGPCFGTAPGAQTVRCISSWPFSGPESGLCFGAAGELQNMTRRRRRAILSNMLYFKSNACGARMTLAWILEGWNPLFQNVSQNLEHQACVPGRRSVLQTQATATFKIKAQCLRKRFYKQRCDFLGKCASGASGLSIRPARCAPNPRHSDFS